MRPRSMTPWLFALVLITSQAHAQQVVIQNATPAVVVEHLKTRLLSQGFTLESANNKEAMFTLDRGLVAQQGNVSVPTAHIVIELQFRFKQKADKLTVTGNEEVVGERGRPMEFRRPAISDRANVQKLLDAVREELEAAMLPADTAAKRDTSTH
jgi:hypothetical protein